MIISNRASAINSNPQFGLIIENEESKDFFQWKISGITKLNLSFESTKDIIRVPLMDTIVKFIIQDNFCNLFVMQAREIESYLRDQNDISAFPIAVDTIFDQLLVKLTRSYFHYIDQNFLKDASFIEKNAYWTKLFKTFLGVEFVIFEKSSLYFLNKRSESIVSFDISE
jgi:hypothetical protein